MSGPSALDVPVPASLHGIHSIASIFLLAETIT